MTDTNNNGEQHMTTTATTAQHGKLERLLERRTYAATMTGGALGIGPAIVSVAIRQTRRDDGTECWPSHSVIIHGEYVGGGGPAIHLDADGLPKGRPYIVGTQLSAECGDLDAMADVAAAASTYAAGDILDVVAGIRRRNQLADDDRTPNAGELVAVGTPAGRIWVGIATGDSDTGDSDNVVVQLDNVVVFDDAGDVQAAYIAAYIAGEVNVAGDRRLIDLDELTFYADRYADTLEAELAELEAARFELDGKISKLAAATHPARALVENELAHQHRCHYTRGADYDAALACICGNELVGEAGR